MTAASATTVTMTTMILTSQADDDAVKRTRNALITGIDGKCGVFFTTR